MTISGDRERTLKEVHGGDGFKRVVIRRQQLHRVRVRVRVI